MNEPRTTQLPIRVPHDRLEAYSKAAERAGMTRNAWIVAQLDKGLQPQERATLEPTIGRGRPASKPS